MQLVIQLLRTTDTIGYPNFEDSDAIGYPTSED